MSKTVKKILQVISYIITRYTGGLEHCVLYSTAISSRPIL
jgi:hypothetical protein